MAPRHSIIEGGGVGPDGAAGCCDGRSVPVCAAAAAAAAAAALACVILFRAYGRHWVWVVLVGVSHRDYIQDAD